MIGQTAFQFLTYCYRIQKCNKMEKYLFLSSVLFIQFCFSFQVKQLLIFDFNNNGSVTNWTEQSDTARKIGMSKATIVLQETELLRKAVFFTLLNPQPNGAGFAGVRTNINLDLSDYNTIALRVRGQGKNKGYKLVLRHKNQHGDPFPSYCQFFEIVLDSHDVVKLPLEKFLPYYRGKMINDTEPLNTSRITNLGIQMYGGVHLPKKQSGVSSLEIDWLVALG